MFVGVPYRILSSYRNEIYGLCALWIVGLHAVTLFGIDFTFGIAVLEPFEWFLRQNLGVDVFLLLSGISCYYSYSSKPDPGRFLSKRLARVYPAFLATYGAAWLLSVLVGSHEFPWMLWHGTLIPFLVEGNLDGAWYVSFIVLMYLLFPYAYSFVYRGNPSNRLACARTVVLMMLAAMVYWLIHKYALDWFGKVEGGGGANPYFPARMLSG